MKFGLNRIFVGMIIAVPLLLIPAAAFAQEEPSECVETGALAFENWTKVDSGGDGSLPAGVQSADYIRCKACHGWDRRGTDGGYVRRSRKDSRPNAGAGDGDSTSRAIVTGTVTAAQITHDGTGRSYAQGQGSWVELAAEPSAENTAAHAGGYTLGNQHPDFTGGGMTQEQVDCLVEFLNFADGDPSMYFADINPSQTPVLYTMPETASFLAGEVVYEGSCEGCHGLEFILDYLEGDGKFSELAHKARWGSADTDMTRSAMGDLTAENISDLLFYLQGMGATGLGVNPGLTGTWFDAARAGEGWLLEVGYAGDALFMFASFYTYDPLGSQAYLLAESTAIDGASAEMVVYMTEGAMWGDDFNSGDVNRPLWGTATFTFPACGEGMVELRANDEMKALGYSDLTTGLTRVLDSGIACPTPD
ncbi:hypothetical protein ACFL1V_05245 [Pseudomonadota bacterium]